MRKTEYILAKKVSMDEYGQPILQSSEKRKTVRLSTGLSPDDSKDSHQTMFDDQMKESPDDENEIEMEVESGESNSGSS